MASGKTSLAKDRIANRIRTWGLGKSFTPKDFPDLASRGTVDVTLSNLTALGTIRRAARGVYYSPKISKILVGLDL